MFLKKKFRNHKNNNKKGKEIESQPLPPKVISIKKIFHRNKV